jgi:hypothetical protein
MRFDDSGVWGIIAIVRFRPLRPVFWSAAIAGLACAAFAWASRAGEGVRNIEVVPFSGIATDTNFERSAPDDLRTLNAWHPTAPNAYHAPAGNSGALPMPRPQQAQQLTPEQQQLLERRRNWVFMTPDDYATPDSSNEKDPVKSQSDGEKNMTAMERFYQHLSDAEKAASTNRLGKANSDRTDDSSDDARRRGDASPFAASPFISSSDSGVFQSIPRNVFGSTFGGGDTVKAQTPEEVRLQAEQKARIDTFKQLFDINQTPAATPVVSTPTTAPIDSAPLFGASTPAMASPFNAAKPVVTPDNSTVRAPAVQQGVLVPRVPTAPHSDFTAPQRSF